jgi:biotin transporter BioY
MNNPYLSRVDWTAMSTATGFGIGFIITALVACLLYKAFPRFRRPEIFFWVMLGILLVTSLGSMLILTPLQVHNGKQAAHIP